MAGTTGGMSRECLHPGQGGGMEGLEGAGEGEEEGGEAVEVGEGGGGGAVGMAVPGAEEIAFGAAADGAGEVGAGGGFGIAGEDELAERGQGGHAPGGFGFEGGEGGGRELGLAGGEFGAEAEEVALDGFDQGGVGGGRELRAKEAEGGVEFIQRTDGVEEGIGFGEAETAGEGGEGLVFHAGRINRTFCGGKGGPEHLI